MLEKNKKMVHRTIPIFWCADTKKNRMVHRTVLEKERMVHRTVLKNKNNELKSRLRLGPPDEVSEKQ